MLTFTLLCRRRVPEAQVEVMVVDVSSQESIKGFRLKVE